MISLPRRVLAEFFGSAALLAIVVGSGHMGETLSGGNLAIALLANSTATGLGLWVLIELFGPVSGAHFNPVVSLVSAFHGTLARRDVALYIGVQLCGAVAGVMLAHLMFDLAPLQTGLKPRSGAGQLLSEAVATGGLVLTIQLGLRSRPQIVPALVGAYIASAYWFTASTSFANPAVTIARALTATFAGIRAGDVAAFIAAQLAGAAGAVVLARLWTGTAAAPAMTRRQPET